MRRTILVSVLTAVLGFGLGMLIIPASDAGQAGGGAQVQPRPAAGSSVQVTLADRPDLFYGKLEHFDRDWIAIRPVSDQPGPEGQERHIFWVPVHAVAFIIEIEE